MMAPCHVFSPRKFFFDILSETLSEISKGETTLSWNEKEKKLRFGILITCTTMLCLCATCGISSIPLLGWHLKGPRRVFTILQQICVTLYLILLVISQFSLHSEAKDAFFDVLAPFMTPDKAALTRYLTTALNFGRKILYVEYYFLSLLQSVDVHIMICHSFKYEGFSSPGKVLRVVVVGTLVCLALFLACYIL